MDLPTDKKTVQRAAREFDDRYTRRNLAFYDIIEPYLQQYIQQDGTGQGESLNGFDEVLISIQGYSLKSLIQAAHPEESYFDEEGAEQLLNTPEQIALGFVHDEFHESWHDLHDTPEFDQLFGAYKRSDEPKREAMDRAMQALINQTVPELVRAANS